MAIKSGNRLRSIGRDFTIQVLQGETSRHPENLDALRELAEELTTAGRLREGLAVDLRLSRLLPQEPGVQYNLACSHALLGSLDEAFEALERAADLGYDDVAHLERDSDLDSLRSDPRFASLLRRLADCKLR